MIQAAGIGTIQTLLATPPEDRDPELADSMYEAVLAQILTDAPAPANGGTLATAVALRAVTPQLEMLSAAERALLLDWLDRAIDALWTTQQPAPRLERQRAIRARFDSELLLRGITAESRRMTVQSSHSLTLLSDNSEAHMALWRLRAALPECAITVEGQRVLVAAAGGLGSITSVEPLERVMSRIPNARTHLAW